MVEKINAEFLFIGGAPRTGTSLFINLLDNHPELLVFPFEHSTIEKYFWNKENISEYAFNNFILDRKEGQQTILANKVFLDQYYDKIKKEYNKEFLVEINNESFIDGYMNYLKNNGVNLKQILLALVEGLLQSNSFARSKYANIKYFVFKQPYYTDLFAQQVKDLLPGAKFIHVCRNPLTRYASAKKRSITINKLNKKNLRHINKVNFIEGHSEVDISSNYLAHKNCEKLGNSYKIVQYESMLKNSSEIFDELFSWLSISKSDCYLKQTLLGKPAFAGSVFVKKTGIDKTALKRHSEYKELTSWNERIVHKYYLTTGGLLNERAPNIFISLIAYILPFKHESLIHYLFKLAKINRLLRTNSGDLKTRLPEGVKKKKYFLSGAI